MLMPEPQSTRSNVTALGCTWALKTSKAPQMMLPWSRGWESELQNRGYYSSRHKNHLEGLLKYRPLGTTPRVSNSEGLGTGLRNCISGLP